MNTLKEKREQLASLVAANDEIANAVEAGTVTDEQRSSYDENITKIEAIQADIKILEQRSSKPAAPVNHTVVDKEAEEIRKNVSMSDFVKAAMNQRAEG